ncbi:MAG: hypothetical protein EHM59_04110 [Betaproteobacteria bacterium]|nr:MAG: hypothetical protein EHM59_04110 [Betaproteobacteria bacterium]
MRVALLIHLLGAIIWIGGMFFAYVALRPAAARVLEPPQRLPLWRETLGRFFTWVWVSIAAIFATGVHMLGSAYGFTGAPHYVLVMLAIALVMTAIFGYVYFVPFKALAQQVDARNWRAAGSVLNVIRRLVATNLALGMATVIVAVIGGVLA